MKNHSEPQTWMSFRLIQILDTCIGEFKRFQKDLKKIYREDLGESLNLVNKDSSHSITSQSYGIKLLNRAYVKAKIKLFSNKRKHS